MDSIFDDESDEVGSDVEAYCPSPRCKADTNHTVISKYEDEIRRVQCVVCGDVHAYRKPRGETSEETSETPSRKKLPKKPTWEEAMSRTNEKDLERCRPYSIRDTYVEGDIVSHPTFHVGFVTELLPDNKLEITFRDERRVLVHNRADLAAKMPAIAEMPPPRTEKKKGKKAKKTGLAERWSEAPAKPASREDVEAKEAAAERAAAAKLGKEAVRDQATKAKGAKANKKAAPPPPPPPAAKAKGKEKEKEKAAKKPLKPAPAPAKKPAARAAAVKKSAATKQAKKGAKAKPVVKKPAKKVAGKRR